MPLVSLLRSYNVGMTSNQSGKTEKRRILDIKANKTVLVLAIQRVGQYYVPYSIMSSTRNSKRRLREADARIS